MQLKLKLSLQAEPMVEKIEDLRFVIDLNEKHFFNSAIEKIDNIVELLPISFSEERYSRNVSEVIYKFDTDSGRWKLNMR